MEKNIDGIGRARTNFAAHNLFLRSEILWLLLLIDFSAFDVSLPVSFSCVPFMDDGVRDSRFDSQTHTHTRTRHIDAVGHFSAASDDACVWH